jgi:hypothetical protein
MDHDVGSVSRVFIGPVEIAGYYTRLASALRSAGVDAVAIDLTGNAYRYDPAPPRQAVVRLATWTTRRALAGRASRIRSWRLWAIAAAVARVPLLVWAILRFDGFIFSFGQTFFRGRELALLRFLGKRLVVVYNGTDARPPYIDGVDMAAIGSVSVSEIVRLAKRKKALIRRFEKHAHAVVSQPAFSHFFERPVVDWFKVGQPWTPAVDARTLRPKTEGPVRILHAPSLAAVKGTAEIRAAVGVLQDEGLDLQLVELENVPNSVVRAEIARADFVIDQLYSDAPMVGFATEAASAGVPAIVGGYAWDELRRIYPGDEMPPVEQCHPDALPSAIRVMALDAGRRDALGASAKAYVEKRWAPDQIATRFLAMLRGEPLPEAMMFDPRSLRYVQGIGMREDRTREIVRALLVAAGRRSLLLEDKPELEQAFVEFAQQA